MEGQEQEEQVYNNSFLDGMHQLFPEILYDNLLFPHSDSTPMLGWLRYRAMHFYPQTFRRYRQSYQARDQATTRNDYEDWQFLYNNNRTPIHTGQTLRNPPPISRVIYRNEFITPTTTPPRTNGFLRESLYTPPRQMQNSVRSWGGEDSLNILSLALGSNMDNWLSAFLESTVPIRPSPAEIAAGSEILQHVSVAEGTMCTICQENAPSPSAQPVEWRRLRGCSHLFHKNCIDRWFSRNAHCPICRADIRVQRAPAPVSTPSREETPDSSM